MISRRNFLKIVSLAAFLTGCHAANDDGEILDGSLDGYKSHGCARMYTAHAKWIYDNIDIGTTVYSIPGFHTHDYSND